MPGEGYFRLFNKQVTDFEWWRTQVQRSKEFDWSRYLPPSLSAEVPTPADIADPAPRHESTTYRILRDTNLARRVKSLHQYRCQLCGYTLCLPNGLMYAEAHHIRPLGEPHNGPDTVENIVCLCPNHHAELDYGARSLQGADLNIVPGHSVAEEYIRYHNHVICKRDRSA
jgi:predicted restriction endonuclease